MMRQTERLSIITGASVFAPESLGSVDVLIGGSAILDVAPGLANSIPHGHIIDGTGMRLTPGLIDSHFHPLGGGDLAGPASRRDPISATELFQSGITSGVGVLAADTTGHTLAAMSLRSADLATSGFSLYWYAGSVSDPCANLTGSVESDVIHLPHCLGVKLAINEPMCASPLDVLAKAAVDATRGARIAGKRGNVHAHVGAGSHGLQPLYNLVERTALPASIFQPTHVNRGIPDLIAQAQPFLEAGGIVDLTATQPLGGGRTPAPDLQSAFAAILDLGPFINQVTFSSDGNVTIPRLDELDQVVDWYRADVSTLLDAWREVANAQSVPLDKALRPVTSNPARVLGLSGRKGCIRPGADADLVLWNGDFTPSIVIAAGHIAYQS